MLFFDFDFPSFLSGLFLSSFAYLLYWNTIAAKRREKIVLFKKSHEEEQRKKQEELQLLQTKIRLDLQREEFTASKALYQQKQEQELRLREENAKLEKEKESLSKTKKSLLSKEKEVEKIRESLTKLVEKQYQAPIEEVIRQVAGETYALEKAKITADLKQLEEMSALKAQNLLLSALERSTLASTRDSISCILNIPSATLIPQLIGKEGKTIRRFEELTGVTARIDESANSLVITSFNGKRRKAAQILADQLLQIGKISLKIVEDLAGQTDKQLEAACVAKGKEVSAQFSLSLPAQVLQKIGELEFYSSWGQNLLLHSMEVAQIAQTLAIDLGLNRESAALMGLLHDIGKILPATDVSHAIAGYKYANEMRLGDHIANGIGAHHKEMATKSAEARLIPIADAISASIPGARFMSLEELQKRSSAVEEAVIEFPGIIQAYCQEGGTHLHLVLHSDAKHLAADPLFKQEILKKIPSVKTCSIQTLGH